jgi:hypothetical protein
VANRFRFIAARRAIMLIRTVLPAAALVAALVVSGCGTNPGDRAASGALLGAAGGAAIGAAAGNAALGAAAAPVGGAVIGAATDPCDLNLGDPVWKNDRGAYERRCGHPYRERYRDRRDY